MTKFGLIFDFLFPRRCLGCGRWGSYFCSQCLNRLLLNDQPICPVCQGRSIGGQTHTGCLTSWALDGLTTIFSYQGLIKKAIRKLKYRFVSDLSAELVEAFLSVCGEDKAFVHFCQERPFFVPIPLHPQRKRWRGFNQSELLGKMITTNLGLVFLPDLLLRTKKTKSQARLNKKERRENIKGAFRLSPHYQLSITNSKLILFDDVWTSGATLKEATKVLKRTGAKKVWGLTLAR